MAVSDPNRTGGNYPSGGGQDTVLPTDPNFPVGSPYNPAPTPYVPYPTMDTPGNRWSPPSVPTPEYSPAPDYSQSQPAGNPYRPGAQPAGNAQYGQPAAQTRADATPNTTGASPDMSWLKGLMGDDTVGLKALDIQSKYNDWLMGTWMPQQYELQRALQIAQQTGDYNGVETLQKQLQLWQEKLSEQQNYVNTMTNVGNLTGMVGNKPTLQLQNLMNQYALAGGNLGLGARGQDLQALLGQMNYGNNLQNIVGQYGEALGGQGVGYGNIAGNLASALGQQGLGWGQVGGNYGAALGQQGLGMKQTEANYDIAQQQLQAQMAQSPLVAWYTARGLPPPAAAFQQFQNNPNFQQTFNQGMQDRFSNALLGQMQSGGVSPLQQQAMQQILGQGAAAQQQQGRFGDALLNQIGRPDQMNLGRFQQPTFNWDQSPVNMENRQAWNYPDQTQANDMWGAIIRGMQGWQSQIPGNGPKAWPQDVWVGQATQVGIPTDIAMHMWQIAGQNGQNPAFALSNPTQFFGIMTQAANQNNMYGGGGPLGAIVPGGGQQMPPKPTGYQLGVQV